MTEGTKLRQITFQDWQESARDLPAAVRQLERRLEVEEPHIQALVPEPGRGDRLLIESADLPAGPLRGVPVGVKDIFQVEGLPTHAGTRLPADELGGPEADSVQTLKRAGCLVLGKTVSTEFAYFASGPTRNPHDPRHTPGGSSSGSAAAVAAGYCPLALGTQTIGSISRPASYCGVVGYKPTYGRISTAGVIPLSPSLDHVGTFTASVPDAAIVAALLCTGWKEAKPDRKPVLAIPSGPFLERATDLGRAHFEIVCEALAAAGWQVEEIQAFPDIDNIQARHQIILAGEAARVHEKWYPRFQDLYHPKTRQLVESGRQIPEVTLAETLSSCELLREDLSQSMSQHQIDLWISPAATGPAPEGLDSTGDPIMSLPWTHAGLPTLSLPAGTSSSGLPMGLQIAAGWDQDECLLTWATDLEATLAGLS
jgi:Asp-tRNA(Asn)/Glu-tRNA(Gln) amidotransferase A subunit family amidase